MAKVIGSSTEFDSTLKAAGDKLVVVDFTASWCGPCKAIAPTYEELARCNPGVVFLKVDVDQNQSTAQKYGIRAMPTFLFLRKSAVLDTLRGANAAKLKQLTQQYSKGGVGSSSSFPGGGQTIAGGSGPQPQQAGAAGLLSQIPKENMLPFAIVLVYLAYIFFGKS